jgi:hypothetical protein
MEMPVVIFPWTEDRSYHGTEDAKDCADKSPDKSKDSTYQACNSSEDAPSYADPDREGEDQEDDDSDAHGVFPSLGSKIILDPKPSKIG